VITEARSRTLDALLRVWGPTLEALQAEPVTLAFHRGWPQGMSLAESLAQHRMRDRERGTTSTGPHRYDVVVRSGARVAREVLSRGQQKLLGAAMALSMARTVGADQRRLPVLLLDDPAAELDALHTSALLREVRSWQGQLVVTALAQQPAALGPPDRAFHVEHGRVTTL
jgi:DNA replication and repair protein RecF